MTPRHKQRRNSFTLIEILVAVVLLSTSLAAVMTLWSVSRRITERSRDTGEYYAIARQEVERERGNSFSYLFILPTAYLSRPWVTDYGQSAESLTFGVNMAFDAPATSGAQYRARSTFYLVSTDSTLPIIESRRRLGVQVIEVFDVDKVLSSFPNDPPTLYRTTVFFTLDDINT